MSLVAGSREVSLGPIIGFQGDVVATPTAYVSKQKVVVKGGGGGTGEGKQGISYLSAYLMNEVKEEKKKILNRNNGSYFGRKNRSEGEELSSASSSIGDPDESDEEHEEQEVQSKLKADLGSLGSLNSLEESLPIKRGLSNFFTGKSKSFASLSQVSVVNDLAKPENPYNKRRRTLLACKLSSSRRGGLYTSINPTSMPLLALNEDDEEIQTDEEQEQEIEKKRDPEDFKALPDLHVRRKFKNFKSKSCFFLTD